ncbi:phosphate transport ATP-binding protein PstB [Aquipluma nitroreducens]|jgi:phosphate transport system ATP-binding protein|uniref:Phosphate transport ATP-binding protein PstB n=1 Tax=Aquipluma nitroreducens TaxID=2010828 RepID=A0A5K7SEI9_9BACT|nr:phosphate ABC transporter ATP-binding protein [Aquipluma nitroreducens]BBE19889.1 phosphate transport ATP-binding protein PstB [Aquipluma nitroreducens]
MIQNLLRVEKFVDSPTEKMKVKRETQDKADGDLILKAHKPHISVRNLNVYLTKNHILKNVNLDIPDKAITCIIGPSGCGKTTLLKTFNRLLQNSLDVRIEGDVLVDGENIHGKGVEVENIRKKMGLLSQRPCPLPMSIFDNIAYGPRIHGIRRKKTLNIMVEKYLKEAGLWDEVKDRLKSPATSLSIGQQQRLCMARGLAVKPEIILGDEATSALDPISSKKIEELFVKLKDQYSIVLVTHTLRQARRIADYVIFMYLGEVIEAGPAAEFFSNPKEKLTKEYLDGYFS